MEYKEIKGIDKKVSRIVIGSMKLSAMEFDDCTALLDGIMQAGCTVLDTAHIYGLGESERKIGKWMEMRGNREKIVLLTKGAHHSADRKRVTPFDILSDIHDSMARLRTGYFDIYLLHRDDPHQPVGPLIETLNSLKAEGRIKLFGASNWSRERIEEAGEYAYAHGLESFTISSPYFGLAEQVEEPWPDCYGITGDARQKDRDFYIRNQMPVFAYSCLGRGFFSGKITSGNYETEKDALDAPSQRAYAGGRNFERLDRAYELANEKGLTVTQIALAYLLCQPLNVYPVIGISKADRLRPLIDALSVRLNEAELRYLNLESRSR